MGLWTAIVRIRNFSPFGSCCKAPKKRTKGWNGMREGLVIWCCYLTSTFPIYSTALSDSTHTHKSSSVIYIGLNILSVQFNIFNLRI